MARQDDRDGRGHHDHPSFGCPQFQVVAGHPAPVQLPTLGGRLCLDQPALDDPCFKRRGATPACTGESRGLQPSYSCCALASSSAAGSVRSRPEQAPLRPLAITPMHTSIRSTPPPTMGTPPVSASSPEIRRVTHTSPSTSVLSAEASRRQHSAFTRLGARTRVSNSAARRLTGARRRSPGTTHPPRSRPSLRSRAR
jgi:hypothetical protein